MVLRVAQRLLLLADPLEVNLHGHAVGAHAARAREHHLRLVAPVMRVVGLLRAFLVGLLHLALASPRVADVVLLVLVELVLEDALVRNDAPRDLHAALEVLLRRARPHLRNNI